MTKLPSITDGPFRVCIRPDCTQLPRYCSASCAYEIQGGGDDMTRQRDAWAEVAKTHAKHIEVAHADLVTARALLQTAAHQLAEHMDDSSVLNEIGAFLARVGR